MKSIFKIHVCIVLTLVVLLSSATVCFATNNTDTVYVFYFGNINSMEHVSSGRTKEDASGTYVRFLDGIATSAYFRIYGGNAPYWGSCTSKYNETKNNKAYVPRGQTGCIRQYVYENRISHYNMNIPYAYIAAYVSVFPSGYTASSANGVWSPDTVGSYQYFN